MRLEGMLFASSTVFFGLLAAAYWILAEEPVGTTALVLTAGLSFLIGFYVLFTARRIDPRPEDQLDAEIADGAGDMGFFSPHSWWPLPVAAGAAVTGLGLIFGVWLVFLGAGLLTLGILGLVFEYYRGDHAH